MKICNKANECQDAKDDPGDHCVPHEENDTCELECPRIRPSKCVDVLEDLKE